MVGIEPGVVNLLVTAGASGSRDVTWRARGNDVAGLPIGRDGVCPKADKYCQHRRDTGNRLHLADSSSPTIGHGVHEHALTLLTPERFDAATRNTPPTMR